MPTIEALIRRTRALIPDAEPIYGDAANEFLFTDEDITDYLEEGFQNAKCAAGLAKQAIGSSEALLLKHIRNYETTTNGGALMKEWVAAGKALYDMGLDEIAAVDAEEGIFEIAFPEYPTRHPEGMSHGSYRGFYW
jgi:hypothetical protein